MNDTTDSVGAAEATGMLEKLFSLSQSRCSGCGVLHEHLEQNGIINVTEWEELLGYGLCWVVQNKAAALEALPGLEVKWGEHCKLVYRLIQEVDLRLDATRRGETARTIRVSTGASVYAQPGLEPVEWVFKFSLTDEPGVDDISFGSVICSSCLKRLLRRHPRLGLVA
jgi:hypothetical protein